MYKPFSKQNYVIKFISDTIRTLRNNQIAVLCASKQQKGNILINSGKIETWDHRKREDLRIGAKKVTSRNGLFIVADVVNGGGDFPVKRPSDIEKHQNHRRHKQKSECELRCWRRHCCSRQASTVRARACACERVRERVTDRFNGIL